MHPRIPIAALSISGAAVVALVASEGYTDHAVIPTKGDRPTIGFGSTFREDGSPVEMGDTITPPKAIARTMKHIEKDEVGVKACVYAPLHQHEYDTMVDFAYQYGVETLCASSMVQLTNAGDYEKACRYYAAYKFAGKRDCSLPINWLGPKGCKGVWTRALARVDRCLTGKLPT